MEKFVSFELFLQYRPLANGNPRPGPPPTLPAPVPLPQNSTRMLNSSQSFCAPNGSQSAIERRNKKLQNGNNAAAVQHVSFKFLPPPFKVLFFACCSGKIIKESFISNTPAIVVHESNEASCSSQDLIAQQ